MKSAAKQISEKMRTNNEVRTEIFSAMEKTEQVSRMNWEIGKTERTNTALQGDDQRHRRRFCGKEDRRETAGLPHSRGT